MSWAIATAAGKDATLALHRARAAGMRISHALSLHDRASGRIRFHGVPAVLVADHAAALDLVPLARATDPDDFEAVFVDALRRLRDAGVEGVVFGNIHLNDVREWYEERVRAAGLRHHEPLWGEAPGALAREVAAVGYRALVVSVDLSRGRREWLGRELSEGLVEEIESQGADPCGEHGEYHTFVFDGPGFRAPVPFSVEGPVEREGHALLSLLRGGAGGAADGSAGASAGRPVGGPDGGPDGPADGPTADGPANGPPAGGPADGPTAGGPADGSGDPAGGAGHEATSGPADPAGE